MKANIEVSYAPDGQVLEIIVPEAIQALPIEARLAIWDEVSFMIEGLKDDEAGVVYSIGSNAIKSDMIKFKGL
jgi:hypothetical protein